MGSDIFFQSTPYSTYSNSINSSLNGITINTFASTPMNKSGASIILDTQPAWPNGVYALNKACSFSSGDTFLTSLTSYLKVGAPIILIDSLGNKEQVKIISFVTNTSFTVSKRSLVVDANVNEFQASGYQNLRIWSGQNANYMGISKISVSPLPITISKFIETFAQRNMEVAYADFKNLAAGTNVLSFPVFSDGTRGNPSNTTAVVTDMQNASTYYSITLGSEISIVNTGGTVSVRLMSIRKP